MSKTSTDPGFDHDDVMDFTREQVAEVVMCLAQNVIDTARRITSLGVISDADLKSIQRCHSAIQRGALILSSLRDAKIAIARAKHWGKA